MFYMLKLGKEIQFFKNFSFPTFKTLILTKHIIIIKYINYIIFFETEKNSKLFCFEIILHLRIFLITLELETQLL